MHYKSTSEKIAIIPRKVTQPLTADIFKENCEIRSTRRKILGSLSIELVVMTIYFILQIADLILHNIRNGKIDKSILIESLITLVSIVYLIAFIIVIAQYFPLGILIFTWLTLIQLIGGSVLLILAIMTIVANLSLINSVGAEIIVDIVFIIVGTSIIVLSVLTILYLLNLMKFIKK